VGIFSEIVLRGADTVVAALDVVSLEVWDVDAAAKVVGAACAGRRGTLDELRITLGLGDDGASGVAALIVLARGVFVAVLPKSNSNLAFT
jgi:hypothetical protein